MSAKSPAPTWLSPKPSSPPQAQQLTAESNLVTTRSNFRRIIGNEPESVGAGLAGRSPFCRERCRVRSNWG